MEHEHQLSNDPQMSGIILGSYFPTITSTMSGGNPTPPMTNMRGGIPPINHVSNMSGGGLRSNQSFKNLSPQGGINIGILLNNKENILGVVKSQETINLAGVHIHKGVIHLSMPSCNGMEKVLVITNLFGVLLFNEEIHLGTLIRP